MKKGDITFMPRYYAVAKKGDKTFQGFVSFEIPVEKMMEIFHSHGASVDFYTNVKKGSDLKNVELGNEEEEDYGRQVTESSTI